MNFYGLTLFPELMEQCMNSSILGRAVNKGIIRFTAVNIRDYTNERHGKVDDYTYGGGAGMLMQAQPVYDAYLAVKQMYPEQETARVIYVTPKGNVFNQDIAEKLSKEKNLIFLCGHYEGIDQRVLDKIVTDEISIGDYVLTGGELPAVIMMDAISRLIPGVLNNEESSQTESFDHNLLEYPQYSRPECWMEENVPEILLSGNHQKISQWRLEQSEELTKARRPDLYEAYLQSEFYQLMHPVKKKKRRNNHSDKNPSE